MRIDFFDKKGFTLIELLVVITIIALLSTLSIVSIGNIKGKARDSRRMHDLSQIGKALIMYNDTYGTWIEVGSGCGYGSNGTGWFNLSGTADYQKSIGQCLVDAGFVSREIIDPTGGKTSNPTAGFTYMKYHCGTPTKVYIYAKLETLPQDSTATDGTCCVSCDSSYGMNYYLRIQ